MKLPKMKLSIAYDQGILEFRTCDKNLLSDGDHVRAEVVRYTDDVHNYTLAYWEQDDEGFDLRFVGGRPFKDEVDWNTFSQLIRLGDILLTDEWNKNRGNDENTC